MVINHGSTFGPRVPDNSCSVVAGMACCWVGDEGASFHGLLGGSWEAILPKGSKDPNNRVLGAQIL